MSLDKNLLRAKVVEEPGTGCWRWIGSRDRATVHIMIDGHKRHAPRVYYEAWRGKPAHRLLRVKGCDPTRACLNPWHWEESQPVVVQGKPRTVPKLTDEQVAEIKTARATGETLQVIADRYGVGFMTVLRAVKGIGKSYSKLKDE